MSDASPFAEADRAGRADRTARVWHSTDLLHPSAPGQGFVRQRWASGAAPMFDVPPVRRWPAEETTAPALEAPELPNPETAVEEAAAPADTTALSEEALNTLREEARAEGLAAGRAEMQAEMKALQATEQVRSEALLSELDRSVRQLMDTPERLFEPLKRLALHLAEQLVLAELTLSATAIERLIQRCVDELAPQRNTPVLVELHPADLQLMYTLMQQHTHAADETAEDGGKSATKPENKPIANAESAAWAAWQLQANDGLLPGSLRVSAHDSVVADLMENRLEALARQLLLDPVRGMAQSAFAPDRLSQRLPGARQVADAQPRMATERRDFGAAPAAEVAEPHVVLDDDVLPPATDFDMPAGNSADEGNSEPLP